MVRPAGRSFQANYRRLFGTPGPEPRAYFISTVDFDPCWVEAVVVGARSASRAPAGGSDSLVVEVREPFGQVRVQTADLVRAYAEETTLSLPPGHLTRPLAHQGLRAGYALR